VLPDDEVAVLAELPQAASPLTAIVAKTPAAIHLPLVMVVPLAHGCLNPVPYLRLVSAKGLGLMGLILID
jgi:hypothetical protein